MYSDIQNGGEASKYPAAVTFCDRANLLDLTGVWSGHALVFHRRIHFMFYITSHPDGLCSSFDCPEAGLTHQPVLETSLCRNIVRFEMDNFNTTCSGRINPQSREITGYIYDAGYSFPLWLKR